MHVSFITANYVAREIGFRGWTDWGAADRATRDAFHGPNFGQKFDELCRLVKQAGFSNIDIWVAHLDPLRATDAMVDRAADTLQRNGLRVVAYTAGLGRPDMARQDAERVYQVARKIGAPLLGVGLNPSNEKLAYELGKEYGIRYAIENHPEKSPRELLDRLGRMPSGYTDLIGVAQDTGFWGMFGYDAVEATHELKDVLFHMHLKQVKRFPDGQWGSCAYDEGVLDMASIVRALVEIGYQDAVSVEHEPHDEDPTEAVVRSGEQLRSWLGSVARS
jgi:sugar phosphate isomerase/epimerase